MLRTTLLLAAAAAALTACSPAQRNETAGAASNSAQAAGDATSGAMASADNAVTGDRTEGPVVSASETPRNPAVDTTPTTGDNGQTPGANSFTEAQARSAIERNGYTGVSALTQNEQGLWQGRATQGGRERAVSVDYRGAVTDQ